MGLFTLSEMAGARYELVMVRVKHPDSEGQIEENAIRLELNGAEESIPLIVSLTDDGPSKELLALKETAFSVESVDYGIGRYGPQRKAAYIGAGIAMGVLPALYSAMGFLLCALWFYRKKLAPAMFSCKVKFQPRWLPARS